MTRVLKIHIPDNSSGSRWSACGNSTRNLTSVASEVTCLSCQSTAAFSAAQYVEQSARRRGEQVVNTYGTPAAGDGPAAFEVTDEVKAALKAMNAIATRYAQRQNLCSQYDDFVRYVNRMLPEGAKLAGRFKHFKVTLAKRDQSFVTEIESESEANARSIAEQYTRSQHQVFLYGWTISAIEEVIY